MHDLAGRIGSWVFQENRSKPLFIKAKNPHQGLPDNDPELAFIVHLKQVMDKPPTHVIHFRHTDKIPEQAILKEFAKSVLAGSPFVFENAPKIPTKVLNIICEYIFLEIMVNKMSMTPEHIANFQRFISAECVPWHTVDSVCRRIARDREREMHKWLLGHKGLRQRVLAGLVDVYDDKRNHTDKWWLKSGNVKRQPS